MECKRPGHPPTQTYTYDALNRLLTAQSAATSGGDCWGQGLGSYNSTPPTLPLADDVLNNQLLVTSTKCSSPAPNWSVNGHNEITNSGFAYDYSGDNTADGGVNTFTFDAENRLTSVVTGGVTYCYAYDGNGLRVQKGHGTCSSPTVDKLYWRDTGGNTIAETDGNGSTINASYNEYVFFAGQRIAQSNPYSGNVFYYLTDHLGSTRVVTNASGTPCYEADFLPYGLENTPSGFANSCSTNYKFTGYERDPETGNDYAIARYYSQREERFLSPDPVNGDISDPQTLNKYAYVRNNPVNFTDPSGLTCEINCGGGGGIPIFCPYCGGGGGGWGDAPLPPPYTAPIVGSNPNPPSGETASGDPWAFGCESLGMPCGMQFPGGGSDPSGCDFVACGLIANGFLSGASGSWNSSWWNRLSSALSLQMAAVHRVSARTLRRAWERFNNEIWPTEPGTGKNLDAHHNQALGDEGTNDPQNIVPMRHDEHMNLHRNNGDFARWGRWASSGRPIPEGEAPVPTEGVGLDEAEIPIEWPF